MSVVRRLTTRRGRVVWLGLATAVLVAGSAAALNARINKSATRAGRPGGGTGTAGTQDNGNNGNGNGNNQDSPKSFTISGSLTGLAPGLTKPLVLTITNPNQQAITVQALTVTPLSANAGCTADKLTAGAFTPLQVPGRSSRTTSITIRLSPAASDACKGVTWPLTYSGTAVKA